MLARVGRWALLPWCAVAALSVAGCGGGGAARGRGSSGAGAGSAPVAPGPLDGLALDEFLHGPAAPPRVRGVHRRWRMNEIAAATGGGFVIAGGGSHRVPGPGGDLVTELVMDIVRVDVDFEVTWRFEMPRGSSPISIAGTLDGGAVATFVTNEAVMLGQTEIPTRAVGVLSLDGAGQLRWARVLATGSQGLPHYLATEPGETSRVALALVDVIARDEQVQPPTEQWGVRLLVLRDDGETDAVATRDWRGLSGLAWAGPGRLLLAGGRNGGPDPERLLLTAEEAGQQRDPAVETERSGVVGILELVDVGTGESLWAREWERITVGWQAVPAVSASGRVAFFDLFPGVDQRGESRFLPMRLVVVDGADGSVVSTRAFDPSCCWLDLVLADRPRGDWLLVLPARCGGYDNHPAALMVDRVGADGEVRWAELLGEPLEAGEGSPTSRRPSIHAKAAAVDETGHLAVVGLGSHVSLAGTRLETNLEPFALVFEP